jgi:hypothetical protein
MTQTDPKPALSVLLLVALAARLPAFLGTPGAAFDMESYQRVARHLLEGGALYGDAVLAGRYPYLPLPALLFVILQLFCWISGAAAWMVFKLPALAGDLGLVWILYRILLRLDPPPLDPVQSRMPLINQRAFWPALAYAANPLAVMISAGHGQFDSLTLFFLLLGAYFFEFSSAPLSDRWAALSLGTAIALKIWPAFLAPLFLKNLLRGRERRQFFLWMMLVPAAASLPFLLWKPGAMLQAVLGYHGTRALSLPEVFKSLCFVGGASPEFFSRLAGSYEAVMLAGLAGMCLVYFLGPWQFPVLPGMSLGVLTLYVFAPAVSPQYLLWLLPLALLLRRPLALRHTWAGLGMGLIFYLVFVPEAVLNGSFSASRQPSWIFLTLWAALNLGLWLFWLKEWRGLLRYCLRPPGWINAQ